MASGALTFFSGLIAQYFTWSFDRANAIPAGMAYDYDKLYSQTADALGAPTAVFVEFFENFQTGTARVLDVGCGQGRDALFIAALGAQVVGVDLSSAGIRDLSAAARAANLAIEGVVANVTDYTPPGDFDVILIDRTLHMLEQEAQLAVLAGMLDHVRAKGWVLIADEARNIGGFVNVFHSDPRDWTVTYRKSGYLFVNRA